jgi:hypothetical protein
MNNFFSATLMCHFVLKGTPKNHVNRGVIKEGPVGIIKKNDSFTHSPKKKVLRANLLRVTGKKVEPD